MDTYIVKGKKLFDGSKFINNFVMVVKDHKIESIGEESSVTLPMNVEIIDVGEKIITPGLIDCHVHVFMNPNMSKAEASQQTSPVDKVAYAINNLESLLKNGVTYCRDVASMNSFGYDIKRLIKDGVVKGPDMIVCGPAICITGGHGYILSKECDGPEKIRAAVRENIKDGCDQIKLMVTGGINTPGPETAPCEMDFEEILAGVTEAHKKNRKVAVHTHGYTGIKYALEAEVDSIEHGLFLDNDLANIAVEKGIFVVPTLSAPHFAAKYGMQDKKKDKSHQKSKEVIETHNKNILNLYKKGGKLAMGSDCGTPFNTFETVLEELILLYNIGITAEDVFRISTSNASELLGISSTHGSLQKGKTASFVVFEKDPFEDIQNVYSSKQVFKDGIRVY